MFKCLNLSDLLHAVRPGTTDFILSTRSYSFGFCKKNKQVLCDDVSLNRELIDTNVKEDLSNYEIVELKKMSQSKLKGSMQSPGRRPRGQSPLEALGF
jgi:hypothetical protein